MFAQVARFEYYGVISKHKGAMMNKYYLKLAALLMIVTNVMPVHAVQDVYEYKNSEGVTEFTDEVKTDKTLKGHTQIQKMTAEKEAQSKQKLEGIMEKDKELDMRQAEQRKRENELRLQTQRQNQQQQSQGNNNQRSDSDDSSGSNYYDNGYYYPNRRPVARPKPNPRPNPRPIQLPVRR